MDIDKDRIYGCFYCISNFKGSEIVEFAGDNTPICPKCPVDAVTEETDIFELVVMRGKAFFR